MNVAEHLEKHTPAPGAEITDNGDMAAMEEDQDEAMDPSSQQYMKYSHLITKLKVFVRNCYAGSTDACVCINPLWGSCRYIQGCEHDRGAIMAGSKVND